jgi:predicted ATPase
MRRGIDAWEAMGTVPGQFFHLTLLAEVYCDAGAVEQGLAVIEEALAMVEASGVCNHEPEIHRIRGELLRARDEAAAETCFRRAIEIAHRQEARWWELRAVRALARLWADQGRVADAHARLAEVYGWFTEGKYLPDLEEARASLEHLARELS